MIFAFSASSVLADSWTDRLGHSGTVKLVIIEKIGLDRVSWLILGTIGLDFLGQMN